MTINLSRDRTVPTIEDFPSIDHIALPNQRVNVPLVRIRETEKAILVQLPVEGPQRSYWLPKSQARFTGDLTGYHKRVSLTVGGKHRALKVGCVNLPAWLYTNMRTAMLAVTV